jgi:hypothetical protein
MPIQVQIITALLVMRDRMDDARRRLRDDRGELTGSVIFLAALAVAAAAVAAIIVIKLRSNAEKVPG